MLELLNELLATLQVDANNLHASHWNIKGTPSFITFHNYFGELYDASSKHVDMIAEFIRIYGSFPISTLREYVDKSRIGESDVQTELMEILMKHRGDSASINSLVKEIFTKTEKFPDVNDYMAAMVADYGKRSWFIESSIVYEER